MLDTFRVRASRDRSVLAVAPAINGNADALRDLQAVVVDLQRRVVALEDWQGEVRLRGEGHVARLEAEANRD